MDIYGKRFLLRDNSMGMKKYIFPLSIDGVSAPT